MPDDLARTQRVPLMTRTQRLPTGAPFYVHRRHAFPRGKDREGGSGLVPREYDEPGVQPLQGTHRTPTTRGANKLLPLATAPFLRMDAT